MLLQPLFQCFDSGERGVHIGPETDHGGAVLSLVLAHGPTESWSSQTHAFQTLQGGRHQRQPLIKINAGEMSGSFLGACGDLMNRGLHRFILLFQDLCFGGVHDLADLVQVFRVSHHFDSNLLDTRHS